MITRSVRHAEQVLSGLDPAAELVPPTGPDARAALLGTILATPRHETTGPSPTAVPVAPPRRTRRLVLVGAVLVVAVSAATVVVGAARPQPAPAYAATPPLLHYQLAADAPTAADLLHRIAAAARQSPTVGTGGYGYISTKDWAMENPNLVDHPGNLRLQPSEMQKWYKTDDGSVRYVQSGPLWPAAVDSTGGPGQNVGYVCWTEQQTPPPICPVDRLADRDVMREVLTLHGTMEIIDGTGRESALGAAAGLFHDLVLPPAVRGRLWDVLADLPGITYTGRVTDRGGRTGDAFSVDFDAQTGPARDTLIVDPRTGQLRSYERTLLKLTNPDYFERWAPGYKPLRISTPAVVAYDVYLASELRPTNK